MDSVSLHICLPIAETFHLKKGLHRSNRLAISIPPEHLNGWVWWLTTSVTFLFFPWNKLDWIRFLNWRFILFVSPINQAKWTDYISLVDYRPVNHICPHLLSCKKGKFYFYTYIVLKIRRSNKGHCVHISLLGNPLICRLFDDEQN